MDFTLFVIHISFTSQKKKKFLKKIKKKLKKKLQKNVFRNPKKKKEYGIKNLWFLNKR